MTTWYNFEDLVPLVIEDSEAMRGLVKLLLHAMRVKTVLTAADGTEAIEMMRKTPPDLIITDLEMTPLDGVEFTRLVRRDADSPAPYVPIIMLTGYTDLRRVARARDAGVNEFLVKPISEKALNARIVEIIERPRQHVKCETYVGPDRRRRNDPDYTGPRRRFDDADQAPDAWQIEVGP